MNKHGTIFTGALQRSKIPGKDDGAGYFRLFRRSAVQRQQLFCIVVQNAVYLHSWPYLPRSWRVDRRFFHIRPTPDPSLEAQLTHEQELHLICTKAIRHKNYLIFGLMILLALALAYGITIDMLNPTIGLF